MRRYALLLMGLLFGLLAVFAGLNLVVDPYDVSGAPGVPGLSARKTRSDEDGARVMIGDRLARGGVASVLVGNSRVVDGFAHPPTNWPGGLFNAGMRGGSVFEMTRAMALAGRSPDLHCVLVGLEADIFDLNGKSKGTYWLSALADGNRALAIGRTALSPQTFARTYQTVVDNLKHEAPPLPWKSVYRPGEQRARFEEGVVGAYQSFQSGRFDPARYAFFERTLDALTAHGVQVIGFIHPAQAWREEAMFRTGYAPRYLGMRARLARAFARYAARRPAFPCVPGGGAVLWDFSGFQPPATAPAPGPQATAPHPYFYELAHYLPPVGEAILDRIQGRNDAGVFSADAFGVELTPDRVDATAQALLARRAAWLATPDGRAATLLYDRAAAHPPRSEPPVQEFLSEDDQRRLFADLARLPHRRSSGTGAGLAR